MTMRMTAAQEVGEDSVDQKEEADRWPRWRASLCEMMDAFNPSIQKAGAGNICEFETNSQILSLVYVEGFRTARAR